MCIHAHNLSINPVNVIKGQNVASSSKPSTAAEWNSESQFDSEKDKSQFRRYEEACDRVKAFYKEQHGARRVIFLPLYALHSFLLTHTLCHYDSTEKQTVEFNLKARENFKKTTRARMSVWEAIELLNTLVDDSDPDVRTHRLTLAHYHSHAFFYF